MAARTYSRRLFAASLVFGLFVLLDIALFSWLIFRSLSEQEVQRVLLETRHEAETIARQIADQAAGHGNLFREIAVERETETYIDSVLRQREILRDVEIHDKKGTLVYKSVSKASIPVAGGVQTPHAPSSPELSGTELSGRIQVKEETRRYEYTVPSVKVPIGDLGTLVVEISGPELARRIERLRGELVRQTSLIGVITLTLLLAAYVSIWWLLRDAARLEKQAADAERMAYIGTLASGLAHEIRNPLNSLNLNMQLLEEELGHGHPVMPASEGGGRLLSITRSEINRLERLVTDFLAYAKPRPLEIEEVPAVWLLEHLGELLLGELQRRGVRLDIEDRSGGARVKVDAAQMTQLLLNLAKNSLVAMEDIGRPPVLRLLAYRHGTEVVLELVDNGIGMPPEEAREDLRPLLLDPEGRHRARPRDRRPDRPGTRRTDRARELAGGGDLGRRPPPLQRPRGPDPRAPGARGRRLPGRVAALHQDGKAPRRGAGPKNGRREGSRLKSPAEPASADLDLLRLRLGRLGDGDGQDAVVELGLDGVLVHPGRQAERAREGAVGPLDPVVVVLRLVLLELALALEGEDVVLDGDLDLLLRDTGQLGLHLVGVRGLEDVDRGRPGPRRLLRVLAAQELVERLAEDVEGVGVGAAGGEAGQGGVHHGVSSLVFWGTRERLAVPLEMASVSQLS